MLGIEPSDRPLDRKVFNLHYDRLRDSGNFNPDLIPQLDVYQTVAVNELKKSFARLKNQINKNDI